MRTFERVLRGEKPPPLRSAMAVEHDGDEWGEACFQDTHSAWVGGASRQLHSVLGGSPPAVFLLAGITRVEHLCRPAPRGEGAYSFEFLDFFEFAKLWELPRSKKVFTAYTETCATLRERCTEASAWFGGRYRMEQPMMRPRTARQLWDGVMTNHLTGGPPAKLSRAFVYEFPKTIQTNECPTYDTTQNNSWSCHACMGRHAGALPELAIAAEAGRPIAARWPPRSSVCRGRGSRAYS